MFQTQYSQKLGNGVIQMSTKIQIQDIELNQVIEHINNSDLEYINGGGEAEFNFGVWVGRKLREWYDSL